MTTAPITARPTASGALVLTPTSATWQEFALTDIILAQAESGSSTISFLEAPALQAGFFVLPAGETDSQAPHVRDEVYIVLAGEAQIAIDDEDVDVQEGDIIFVRAGTDHRFHDITSELQTLVIFSAAPSDETTPGWLKFEQVDILARRQQGRNVWNQFLSVPSLRFGMYMLPQSIDGDVPLTHAFDEINVVVNGRSTFRMDDAEIEIEPGSVIYVPAGIAHNFHSLVDDVDVLILWNGP